MLGYGSQALALKYLGANFEHWKTCEWAVKSIQAYKDIHFTNMDFDFSGNLNKENLVDSLYKLGISNNYNEPMDKEQITRLNEKELRDIYNNIIINKNLVNIQKVKGKDLEIVDKNIYDYILTYSFPCQDLSLAGKGKGMKDTSTRSGMLWEVERILYECKELGELPQILLMENVPQVHSKDNIEDFIKWELSLEKLGYKNYWKDLIATDYGIPQTRNRCFMISILGNYNYTFPKKIPLKLKLKDMLEDNVDEKYYLSDKQINQIKKWNAYEKPLEHLEDENCGTLTTRSGAFSSSIKLTYDNSNVKENKHNDKNMVIGTYQYSKSDKFMHGKDRFQEGKETSDTLQTTPKEGIVLIKNYTKKGYLEAKSGYGIDISSRMEHHRGTVQKDKIQTITTSGGNERGVIVLGNYMPSNHEASRVINSNGVAPTFKENHGTINAIQTKDLKIRKLTPKECFRLMGVKDSDYENCAKNQSNASLYHLAGDSIVVNVLIAIFKQLLEGE